MFSLEDVAFFICSLNIVDENHIWIGKLQEKVEKSIGVYPLRRNGVPKIPIGGKDNTDHGTRQFSILIHWNKDVVNTEEQSFSLFEKLRETKNITINNQKIKFIKMLVPEPVPVGTDGNGVYEYVIEIEIYYER